MRILLVSLLHIRDSHKPHNLKRFFLHFLLRNIRSPKEDLLDLGADSHGRVQRCHRILEYESDILSPKLSKFLVAHLEHIFSIK